MSTESTKPAPVDFAAVLDAFEYASAGMNGEWRACIQVDTGKVYSWCTTGDVEDEYQDVLEDVDTSDNYIELPDRHELDLGQRLVFAFVDSEIPKYYDTVSDIFRRRRAYRWFKDFLSSRNELERWYEFEASTTRDRLRAWCEAQGFELVESPGPDAG